jgi:PKHD-type hydroxylase
VKRALATHKAFVEATHPVAFSTPLFTRYEPGMSYPPHIDAAIMGGVRTDVAVTVFLNEPECYEGGELVINTGTTEQSIKLNAGDAIAYPATTFHHVREVESGVRSTAVLWLQSRVKDPEQRALLNRLAKIVHKYSHTAVGPRLHRGYWNLQRLWSDTIPPLTSTDPET